MLYLVLEARIFLLIAYFSSPYAHAATKGEDFIKSKNILERCQICRFEKYTVREDMKAVRKLSS